MPKPPYDITVKVVTANSVNLVWTPTSTDETYVVQYAEKAAGTEATGGGRNSGTLHEVTTDIGSTKFTVTGLRALTRYEFRVIAANTFGRGAPSSPLEITTVKEGKISSTLYPS